jgi:hypothetical protein
MAASSHVKFFDGFRTFLSGLLQLKRYQQDVDSPGHNVGTVAVRMVMVDPISIAELKPYCVAHMASEHKVFFFQILHKGVNCDNYLQNKYEHKLPI